MEALLLCLCVFSSGLAGNCPVPPTSRTSNGNNFCKGRLRRFRLPLLEATSTVVPRTKPSFPGCNSALLPSFQVLRFDFPSSISVTMSLGATDCARLAPSLADLWCYLRSTTYSRFQRFQNWPSNLDKQRCLLVRSWTSVSSSSAVAHSSGMYRIPLTVNGWEDVRGSSVSSEDTQVSGLEFSTHSTSTTTVKSSSYVNFTFFKIFLRQRLTQRIMCSKKPPHHGANFKLDLHSILWSKRKLWTSGNSKRDDKNLAAVLTVWVLSNTISFGIPRLQMKRLKLLINVSVLRSGTTSTWTALLLPQV